MRRMMFITVGTSLFQSASWEEAAVPASEVPYYAEWLEPGEPGRPGPRESPEARLDSPHAARIRAALREGLTARNAGEWASRLPPGLAAADPAEPMRYSAELATLLHLCEAEGLSLSDLLATYGRIHVVFDGDPADLSAAAGAHLVAYLNRVAGAELAQSLPVSGLSSPDPQRLLGSAHEKGALKRLVEQLMGEVREAGGELERVDLVVSGGYKIYGVVLARLADLGEGQRRRLGLHAQRPAFRLAYIHEKGSGLVTYSGGLLAVGEERVRIEALYEPGGPGL